MKRVRSGYARTTMMLCRSAGRRRARRKRFRRPLHAAIRRRLEVPPLRRWSGRIRRGPGQWLRAWRKQVALKDITDDYTGDLMATVADAGLILQLYELRQEETLRRARKFMVFEFNPKTLEELRAVSRNPGSQENAYWRQTVSYWEMAASFVLRGAIDQ